MEFTNLANGIDEQVTILMHNQSGYYNVSRALKEVGRDLGLPKKWNHWYETGSAKAIIQACEQEIGINENESFFSIKNGSNNYRGTYVH